MNPPTLFHFGSNMQVRFAFAIIAMTFVVASLPAQTPPAPQYAKKATRVETAIATLNSFGMPSLEGKWYFAGPFDNVDRKAVDTVFAPEKEVKLKETFTGKAGEQFGWKEIPKFALGKIVDLKKLIPKNNSDAVIYLYHEFEATETGRLPISLGADDTMSLWNNGSRLVHEDRETAAAPDQFWTQLKYKPGKNTVLIKVCQYGGGWEVYVAPELPDTLPDGVQKQYEKDFPKGGSSGVAAKAASDADSKHYAITTIPLPADCVLEVGGLAFRPDGKLLACTRRGEIWLIENPTSDTPGEIKFTKYASGLHESLGMYVEDDKTLFVVQRPELTKVTDALGQGKASEFKTVCDKWGVSGDYHEYAFGPARDKDGNFFISLNVGFGGGHQSKGAFRGWCVKVDPKTGSMEPFAYGLRSPNGINFSPEGELFYCDNQGEWAASNKMNHLKKGKFYGHQAALRWLKDSPFASHSDKVASGMMYDGNPPPGKTAPKGFPELDPPCIWFPYGRMGQSVSEPIWDTTGGKFGPFAGQVFVGDQNKAMLMRVALEKVNDVYQGACFPFRYGFQCGVNRLAFAPDGSLFVGQTSRGWGGLGGKPFGLQRVKFTGDMPTEIQSVKLTEAGFDFHFTKPMDPATLDAAKTVALKSFTYIYQSSYGCPETDTRPEKVLSAKLSPDGKTLSLAVPDLARGRVYDFHLNGLKAADGSPLLHADAYYTLNEFVK